MTDIISTLSNLSIVQLLAVGAVIVILQKSGIDVVGFLRSLFKKNGNGVKDKIVDMDEKLELLMNNHVGHLEKNLDEMKTMQQEALFILKDFKEEGIKIKK